MNPNEVGSGAVVAVVVAELIELAKRSPAVSWLTVDTGTLNRVVGGVAAFVAGLGIQAHFDAQAGELVVSGLFLGSVLHGVAQWAVQQAYYRMAIRK